MLICYLWKERLWMTVYMFEWKNECMFERKNECMFEWKNEWTYDWMRDELDECYVWQNECMRGTTTPSKLKKAEK